MVTANMIKSGEARIAMVGLGYVGLPLAVMFGRRVEVIGFDISTRKIGELRRNVDTTLEVATADLKSASIAYTDDPAELKKGSFIIVTVPTPIDDHKKPDLTRRVGHPHGRTESQQGAIVIYESTVYPGVTEDICVPILEQESGLVCGRDFKVGYSPERINPGDKVHTVDKIVKVRFRPGRRDSEDGGGGLPHGHHGGCARGVQHPCRRSSQGHRKHPAGHQHRADERAFHHLQQDGNPD